MSTCYFKYLIKNKLLASYLLFTSICKLFTSTCDLFTSFCGIFKNYLVNNTLLEIEIKMCFFFLLKNLVIWLVITCYLFRKYIFVIVKIIQCLNIEICIYIFYLSSLCNTWLEDNEYLKIKMDTKRITSIKRVMSICV